MAVLQFGDHFCADEHFGLVTGVAAEITGHDSGLHFHNKDQLLSSQQGCMVITLDNIKYVLPPMRAAWIPAGLVHNAQSTYLAHYRSLYFDNSLIPRLPRKVKILDISPLMRLLIERMAFWPFDKPDIEQLNTLNLFIEELNQASDTHLHLPLPKDHRLQSWLAGINNSEFMAPTLSELSKQVGASDKTITRIFNRETGMPYQSWRQQWRLLGAIELLSNGMSISDVAHRLEFSSDSAFIYFFRQKTGVTPLNFLSQKEGS